MEENLNWGKEGDLVLFHG